METVRVLLALSQSFQTPQKPLIRQVQWCDRIQHGSRQDARTRGRKSGALGRWGGQRGIGWKSKEHGLPMNEIVRRK